MCVLVVNSVLVSIATPRERINAISEIMSRKRGLWEEHLSLLGVQSGVINNF